MSVLQAILGAALVVGYLAIEQRGMVFGGTDGRPPPPSLASRSGGSGGGGGGVFFWGSGYRGGK